MKDIVVLRQHRIEVLKSTLEAGSPATVLGRGYALLKDPENGKIITRPDQTRPGNKINIELGAGGIGARVEELKP